MRPFTYSRVGAEGDALREGAAAGGAYVAGGTTLLDLMKIGVSSPSRLIDINPLPLAKVDDLPGGGLRVGAMVRNSDLAYDARVRGRYPALSEAILAGASPQLRNMATTGGNLLQRTRCPYFRDPSAACNKRAPGTGCDAYEGYNRSCAVLGVSHSCIASHPSDMCVALAAFDAVVVVRGASGERKIAFIDFHLTPGEHPERETVLAPGELVVAVELPATPFFARSTYVKVRDRASYAFALASAAVALDLQGGQVRSARVALGGVATKPWRSPEAEAALVGHAPGEGAFRAAADLALRGAQGFAHNTFKIELAKRVVVRALALAGAKA